MTLPHLLCTSDCNFLANLSFTRPRLSPIFLTRLHKTTRPDILSIFINFCHFCSMYKYTYFYQNVLSRFLTLAYWCKSSILSSLSLSILSFSSCSSFWKICFKIRTFWEAHKIWKKSSSWFGHLLSKCTKHEEDFAIFCVLLR